MSKQTPQEYLMTAVESLISSVQALSKRVIVLEEPDPRATPDEFMKEMLTGELNLMKDRLNSLVKAVEGFAEGTVIDGQRIAKLEEFLTPIMEDNLIEHHGEQIRRLQEEADG